jgi:thioredoxin 1
VSDKVMEVSDTTFDQEVLKSSVPVLIDFWAPWCGPCKAIAPVVEELAGAYNGRLKVVKMNVDDNPQTPSKYGVRGPRGAAAVWNRGRPARMARAAR